MKYLFKFVFCALVITAFSTVALQARTLKVEDFNRTSFVGPLGPHNVWMMDEDDPTSGIRADFARTRDGHALKLTYSVDSPATTIWGSAFIPDYSEFNIIGMADGLPHVSPCGYFFKLGNANLTRYEYLVFSARGDEFDGFTRKIQIELKTANRTSSFILDGIGPTWRKFAVPLSVFDRIDDWTNVSELAIAFNEIATAERGTIYLDNIYFAVNPDHVPASDGGYGRPVEEKDVFDYRLYQIVETGVNFRQTPERGAELFSSAGGVIQGKHGPLTGRLRFSVDATEFGAAGFRRPLDDYPYSRFEQPSRDIYFPTVQLKVHGLTPLAARITLGHLYLGYSPYVFSPFFGYKGLKVEGSKELFDHSTFVIKKPLNSFSVGSQMAAYIGDHRLQLLGVYDYETAKLPSSSSGPGFLQEGEMDIKEVSNEFAWELGALLRLLDYRLNFELKYADFRFKQRAHADYEFPEEPAYSHNISSPTLTDNMYEANLYLTGLPIYGSRLLFSYREVGTDFIPAYRQEPGVFENIFADSRGFLLRGEQWYEDYGARLWWETRDRISDSDYGIDVISYGLMYRGPSEMELALSMEHKKESYEYLPRKIDLRDLKMTSLIFAGRYNFFYADTPGIRFPLTLTFEFREDRIDNRVEKKDEVNHVMRLGLEYQLRSNLGFSADLRASTRNNPADLTDNAFNMYLNGTF